MDRLSCACNKKNRSIVQIPRLEKETKKKEQNKKKILSTSLNLLFLNCWSLSFTRNACLRRITALNNDVYDKILASKANMIRNVVENLSKCIRCGSRRLISLCLTWNGDFWVFLSIAANSRNRIKQMKKCYQTEYTIKIYQQNGNVSLFQWEKVPRNE